MTRDAFNKGIKELQLAFPKLEMNKGMAELWYKYSKNSTDNEWKEKVNNCIRGCHRIPTLADVLDRKGYLADDYFRA